jgi:hypothetical protein
MTEKQFLKNFKKHCEIARDLGIYKKARIEIELKLGKCPFDCGACELFHELLYCGEPCKCNPLTDLKSYQPNADFYIHTEIEDLSIKMLSILKSIPWRI